MISIMGKLALGLRELSVLFSSFSINLKLLYKIKNTKFKFKHKEAI
jgi:hypothetical protein